MSRVLVVDDSAVDRRLMEGLLRAQKEWRGWTVEQADNGAMALAKIRANPPDIVLSDLIMPEMDGLQLLSHIKERYSSIPVVIITGRGSEWMAVKALRRGAASYVPKAKLSELLVDVVRQVLESTECDRSYQRLLAGLMHSTYEFCIDSDPMLISPLVNLLQQMAHLLGVCDAMGRNQLGVALDEALLNAIYHGNLELPRVLLPEARNALRLGQIPEIMQQRLSEPPFRDRKVYVAARLTREEARFLIRNEGSGLRPEMIPNVEDANSLTDEGGRGLVLIRNFMDDVQVNSDGNELLLVKRGQNGAA